MTAETREFSARRERIALRAAHERHSAGARAANATDVDLGNYAAIMFDSALWVSATPVLPDAARPSALGAALAYVARSGADLASRVVVVDPHDEARAGITARRAAYFDFTIDVLGAHDAHFMYGQLLSFPLDFILCLLLDLYQHLRHVCELLIFIR